MEFVTMSTLTIIFIATLVSSTSVSGQSLIAVPLLLFFIPIDVAVPLSVLISIVIAGIVVIQDRKEIHFHSAKWLILFAFLGIPIGLFLLIYGNEKLVKSVLGGFIILYAIYSLFSTNTFRLQSDNKIWLFICGFL